MALVLAAAAVLFAPLTAVWWLLLAALTLLLLYAVRFGGRHASSAPLRAWLRPAALLLACVTALGCWNGDAAHPAAVDTAARWTAAQADILRYGSNAGLPEGDMTKVGPRRTTEDTMLEVTMTQPTSYYLRGFVGETYANSRWSTLDSKTLSEDADTFYWLHQDGFYAQSQLTTAAQAGVPDALGYDNTVTVQNVGASGKYLYAPYELLADSDVLDAAQIGDRTLLASGRGGSGRTASTPATISSPSTSGLLRHCWRRRSRPMPFLIQRRPITASSTTTIRTSPMISAVFWRRSWAAIRKTRGRYTSITGGPSRTSCSI